MPPTPQGRQALFSKISELFLRAIYLRKRIVRHVGEGKGASQAASPLGLASKSPAAWKPGSRAARSGGELGIRTPDSLEDYTRLAGEHLRPLGQLSK